MQKWLIGVTGNVASGKSSVARTFRELGCVLIDADKVAHDLYVQRPSLVDRIVFEFGHEVRHPDQSLNRARLGAMVFGDPERMDALNRIVHPELVREIHERIRTAFRMMNRVVLDAALIFELGFHRDMHAVVFVSAPEESRLQRLIERNGLSRFEAEKRLRSQRPEEEKIPMATYVILNTGDEAELNTKALEVYTAIEARMDVTKDEG